MTRDDRTDAVDVDAVLDGIMIAAPCDMSWESMQGDERVRFCGACKLNVYNTRTMTRREVVELMLREGRLPCLRIYRRFDGTLITDDCPVGLRKIRDAYRLAARRVAAGWAALVSLVTAVVSGLVPAWGQESQTEAGKDCSGGARDSTRSDDFVGLVEPSAWMPRVGPAGLSQDPSEIEADTHAQKKAMEFYLKALEADRKHQDEADDLYRKALESIGGTHQDPKFVEHVCRNYARFLVDHDQSEKAKVILKQYKKYKEWLAQHPAKNMGTAVGGMGLISVPGRFDGKFRRGH